MAMDRNQLKYLAIAAMLLDHIAYKFVPAGIVHETMRFIGRLANPIMCYFIAEGYIHTRDIRKYILRLAVFALISWLPFDLFVYGEWPRANLGVIFTLLLGLLAITVYDAVRLNVAEKCAVIAGLCFLSRYGDWRYVNVILPLIFFMFREDVVKKWAAYYAFTLLIMTRSGFLVYNCGRLIFPLFLTCYNGEGGEKSVFQKWIFYVFYPVHLLILWQMR